MSQLISTENLTGYSYNGINGVIGGSIVSPVINVGRDISLATLDIVYEGIHVAEQTKTSGEYIVLANQELVFTGKLANLEVGLSLKKYEDGQWEEYVIPTPASSMPFDVYKLINNTSSNISPTITVTQVKAYYKTNSDPWIEYIDEIVPTAPDTTFNSCQYKIEIITSDDDVSPKIIEINIDSESTDTVSKIVSSIVGPATTSTFQIPTNPENETLTNITLEKFIFETSGCSVANPITVSALGEDENIIGDSLVVTTNGVHTFYFKDSMAENMLFTFSQNGQKLYNIQLESSNYYLQSEVYSDSVYSSPTYYNNHGHLTNTLIDTSGLEVNIVSLIDRVYTSIFTTLPYWFDASDKELVEKVHNIKLADAFRKDNPLIEISLSYDNMIITDGSDIEIDDHALVSGNVDLNVPAIDAQYISGGSLSASQEYKVKVKDSNIKHVQYGKGIIIIDDIDGLNLPFVKTFSPLTVMNGDEPIQYACHISDGWDIPSNNITIVWDFDHNIPQSPILPNKHGEIYHSPINGSDFKGFVVKLKSSVQLSNYKVRRLKNSKKYLTIINNNTANQTPKQETITFPIISELIPNYDLTKIYPKGSLVQITVEDEKLYYISLKDTLADKLADITYWTNVTIKNTINSVVIESVKEVENGIDIPVNLIRYNLDGIFECDYKAYINSESVKIAKDNSIKAICTNALDYDSGWLSLEDLPIQEDTDYQSVQLKISIDNTKLKAYIDRRENNQYKVIITSNGYNSRVNFIPSINGGVYNIGNDEYFFLTNPDKIDREDLLIPITSGIKYIKGSDSYHAYKAPVVNNLLGNFETTNNYMAMFNLDTGLYPSEYILPSNYTYPMKEEE